MAGSISLLVTAAAHGNATALAELMSIAFGSNLFLARRASQELREHFNIITQ